MGGDASCPFFFTLTRRELVGAVPRVPALLYQIRVYYSRYCHCERQRSNRKDSVNYERFIKGMDNPDLVLVDSF